MGRLNPNLLHEKWKFCKSCTSMMLFVSCARLHALLERCFIERCFIVCHVLPRQTRSHSVSPLFFSLQMFLLANRCCRSRMRTTRWRQTSRGSSRKTRRRSSRRQKSGRSTSPVRDEGRTLVVSRARGAGGVPVVADVVGPTDGKGKMVEGWRSRFVSDVFLRTSAAALVLFGITVAFFVAEPAGYLLVPALSFIFLLEAALSL